MAADTQRLQRLRTALDQARGDDPSIAARAGRLARLADDLDGLAAQVGTVEQLGDQVAAALQRAEEAALARGLGSLEEVAAMARDDEEVARLDEARRRHDSELASVREQLDEPSLTGLADSPAPELHVLRERATELQAARAEAGAAAAAAAGRVKALQRLAGTLADILAERGPVAEHHHTVDGLSRLAEGKSTDNRLRMSLSGYVLAARLEQVAASASQRLALMSSGRYQLVHTPEAGQRPRPRRAAPAGARCLDRGRARPGVTLRRRELLGFARPGAGPRRRRDRRGGGLAAGDTVRRRGVRQPRRGDPRRGDGRAGRPPRRRPGRSAS